MFSAAFSPDSHQILTGSEDQTAKLWETLTAKQLLTLRGHNAWILQAVFSADGQRIATGSADYTAKIWEAATGNELLTLTGHTAGVLSVAFSPNRQSIVSGSADQTAKVWDAFSGRERFTLKGHTSWVPSVAFSPNGERILTGSADQTARVWEAISGEHLLTLRGHSAWIGSVAFSRDGQRIATGSGDQTARIWDAATGQELLILRGHGHVVNCVGFSPDGKRIVTGSYDQTAKLWDAATGKELLTLQGHRNWIHSAAFSPDGNRIVTGSVDQTARIWEAASEEQVTVWRKEEQSAAEKMAIRRRERAAIEDRDLAVRAQGGGAIKLWLVLLPIAFDGAKGDRVLMEEQVLNESRLRPRTGDRINIDGLELTWREVRLEDYTLDFNRLLATPAQRSVAYAVAYIRSESLLKDLLLKVRSDDQAKIYLNEKLIYQFAADRSSLAAEDVVAGVELNAGLNVLVFKVLNETGEWQGSVRFTDRDGNPVAGLGVTADPKGIEFP